MLVRRMRFLLRGTITHVVDRITTSLQSLTVLDLQIAGFSLAMTVSRSKRFRERQTMARHSWSAAGRIEDAASHF